MRAAIEDQARPTIAALLPAPQDALRSLRVSVPAASQTPGGWWVFHTAVECAGTSYVLLRRYREFSALHSTLGAGGAALPAFPPKRSTRSQNERFAHKRRQELEAYLAKLATAQTRYRPELHSFLELGLLLGGDRTTTNRIPDAAFESTPGASASPLTSPHAQSKPLATPRPTASSTNPFGSVSGSPPSPPNSDAPSTREPAAGRSSTGPRQLASSAHGNPFGSLGGSSSETPCPTRSTNPFGSASGSLPALGAAMPASARSTNPF